MPGLAASAIGLFALTYALIEANTYGWTSTRILVLFVVAAVALVAFVYLEMHQRLPMIDLSLFRNPTFAGANAVMLLVALAMFGVFFFVSLFIQNVLGYSATQAGASFLPMTLLIILVAPVAGKLSDRIGSRWLIGERDGRSSPGPLLIFASLDENATFWNLLPAMLIGGVGMALSMTPTTAAAMGSVPTDKAGVGSAVLNSMRQVGGSLGHRDHGRDRRRVRHGPERHGGGHATSSSPASITRSSSRPGSPSRRAVARRRDHPTSTSQARAGPRRPKQG